MQIPQNGLHAEMCRQCVFGHGWKNDTSSLKSSYLGVTIMVFAGMRTHKQKKKTEAITLF